MGVREGIYKINECFKPHKLLCQKTKSQKLLERTLSSFYFIFDSTLLSSTMIYRPYHKIMQWYDDGISSTNIPSLTCYFYCILSKSFFIIEQTHELILPTKKKNSFCKYNQTMRLICGMGKIIINIPIHLAMIWNLKLWTQSNNNFVKYIIIWWVVCIF